MLSISEVPFLFLAVCKLILLSCFDSPQWRSCLLQHRLARGVPVPVAYFVPCCRFRMLHTVVCLLFCMWCCFCFCGPILLESWVPNLARDGWLPCKQLSVQGYSWALRVCVCSKEVYDTSNHSLCDHMNHKLWFGRPRLADSVQSGMAYRRVDFKECALFLPWKKYVQHQKN